MVMSPAAGGLAGSDGSSAVGSLSRPIRFYQAWSGGAAGAGVAVPDQS